ncbi:MAG: DNA mismatch repair endonuclease MutL [Planctomycetales bacterium]|nr:DNA mismatch repair endonuclease MutL [Planctomycetales bacterium]
MPIIRQLPPSLVNKIAAGEVIERPASVVKELLENSVDAGASQIELGIEGGGIERIRISDNGCGIPAEQIGLAIASHATSKLQTADDLFDVHTLGFRGEALASIAEISHLTLRTRTADSDAGAELSVQGGEASPLQPTGCPVGTTIEVRNLFFNTPVRRKFMRTPQTEAGHITEAFTRIALAFPQVQMTMTSGQRTQFELPATDSWSERIRAFFGDEVADSLIAVESQQESGRLAGFVADPSVSRSNNRMQYLFLNGRHIRDRSLQHALSEAYRGLLMVGRFPVCFLRLELPPNQVDVNVHPTKMEVRFQEGGKIYSQLLQTLRHQFLTSDLTARARHVPGPVPGGLQSPARTDATDQVPLPPTRDEARWQSHAARVTQVEPLAGGTPRLDLPDSIPPFRPFAGRGPMAWQGTVPESPPSTASSTAAVPTDLDPGALPAVESSPLSAAAAAHSPAHSGTDAARGTPDEPPAASQPAVAGQASHLGFQVHNRYLITQDESGMVIIDQHALHERILYEQLRQKIESQSVERQKLLVPEPLDLTPSEAAAALDSRELLAEIGIELEPFGGDTVLMTSYPAMLSKLRPAEVLRQVLEPLMAGGKEPSPRDLLDELLNMMACKAAIKAGDPLSAEEITALLEQRNLYQDTHHCPHGRPTALFFSRDQLDKMFKRT